MSESNRSLIPILRHIDEREMYKHMESIVVEGFDYTNPCDYVTFKPYLGEILNDSTVTLINSYVIKIDDDKYMELYKYIYSIIKSKFYDLIEEEFNYWQKEECDDGPYIRH